MTPADRAPATPAPQPDVERIVAAALAEDAPWGDVSSEAFVPEQARITARVVAREPGVLSGTNALEAAFRLVDPAVSVTLHLTDGADLSPAPSSPRSRAPPARCCAPSAWR